MMPGPAPPLVSVVMPVWNGERYLAEAIESILTQTHGHLELVIVDDGSEDGTRDIIARHAEGDERVRPVRTAHQGLIPTLNIGCEAARGEYIARLDYDDVALPERLERQVAFLEHHPDVALVATAVQCIDATGLRREIVVRPPSEDAGIRQTLTRANPFCHSSVMMRREVWARVGGYRYPYVDAEDYDLWIRFADGHELASIPDVLVLYRLHADQISLTRLERQALAVLAVRASTEIRRRTGVEPLAECQVIDRSTVRSLGVGDEQIDAYLVDRYLACLATLPKMGLATPALEALREAVAHPSLRGELATRLEEAR